MNISDTDSDIDDIMDAISPNESEYSDLDTSDDEYLPSEEDTDSDSPGPRNNLATKQRQKRPRDESDDQDDIPLSVLKTRIYAEDVDILTQMLDEPMWADIPFIAPDTTFVGEQQAIPENLKNPYEFFKDVVTDQMIEVIETQANIYGLQKSGKELKTTKKEIELFIGLYLRMGLMKAHNVKVYWAGDTRHPPVANEMSRNRFTKLATHVHFVNNEEISDEAKEQDRLWKIRPWIDMHRKQLEKITPIQCQSVDEIMVAFKGRSPMKQYIRNKPHRWGFKLWARAGSDGILHDWDVYQGSVGKTKGKSTGASLGLSGDVVMTMTKKLADGKNYKVYADNFFSSLDVANALKDRGIWFTGTVRENRLKGCCLKSEKALKKEQRGSHDAVVEVNSNTTVVRWLDNRKVDLISTCTSIEPISKVTRYDKKQKQKIEVPCPAVVQEYNQKMGGVDLIDCLTALYKYPLKSRRWYMYIFYHSICASVVTAWLLYRRHCVLLKEKHMNLSEFQSEVAQCLIKVQRSRGRPTLLQAVSPLQVRQAAPEHAPVHLVRLDGVGHMPEWSARARCKLPSCHNLSFLKCMKCNVHLCLNKERNCFIDFHSK